MAFELFPAIDLRAGRCVRLLRGDFDEETVYGTDPVAVARGFEAAGASWIHVVDLDAARTGAPGNEDAIRAIAAAVTCSVQVGGGVREVSTAQRLCDAGVRRVVVGTAAVERPELVDEIGDSVGVAVAVGLDVLGGEVQVRGWTEGSGRGLADVLASFAERSVDAFVVTRIEADGTMEGPDATGIAELLGTVDTPVLASGGVGSLDDLEVLAGLARRYPHLVGVIVGRALYEGRFTAEEAMAACSRPG
ncbi:MAG: 1-(5-phosphoribosyl)-5-[(5-phosphoribosylamino)methylideneamino]imidazole-4-carboxamide isomerase [Acidimicrobiia bacterium]|nr:1-(5-phosphoribosyl)-5-[(5-phosphoribosylamino)methylideneamino]imidazole-4-carboxamide isomerase [Acidimicrobiia bacterium]